MANFETKIKRTIIDPKSGNDKVLTETFFVENAVSFGDAETRIQTYWNCECDVIALAISKVMEVVNIPTDEEKLDLYVFRAILVSTFEDEDGNTKETKYPILVWAKNVENAMSIVTEFIKQGYNDMTLTAITKTKIVEVI